MWRGTGPLRLVTHHWGANHQKGSDTYTMLDGMLEDLKIRAGLAFTYIGNLPEGIRFRHATVVPPMHGHELAAAIRSHHVYVTGSQNEPAGMHHIEGAACGLPLLYRRSGALPEYCAAFGVGFDGPDLPRALRELALTYHVWADRVQSYPYSADAMCRQYLVLFKELLLRRERSWNDNTTGTL
jgi:hypothetical protein